LKNLAVAYGGIQAVKGINLRVDPGELVCLIGANGAGKTTTLKGICGMLPIKAGSIHYDGRDVTGRPPFELVRSGLAMVPEGRGVFGKATGERGDGERGRWGSDAYADSRISCGAIHIFDTAQHQ